MLGITSSKTLKKAELYDNLFQSIDQQFVESEEDLSLYEWAKDTIFDGRDFTYKPHDLHEYVVERIKELMKQIDGETRGKLPCEEEDD